MKLRGTPPSCRAACAAPAQFCGDVCTLRGTVSYVTQNCNLTDILFLKVFHLLDLAQAIVLGWIGNLGCCWAPAVLAAFEAAANPGCFGGLHPASLVWKLKKPDSSMVKSQANNSSCSTVLFLNTRRMLISNPFKESVRRGLNQVLRQAFNQNVSAQVSVLGLPACSH